MADNKKSSFLKWVVLIPLILLLVWGLSDFAESYISDEDGYRAGVLYKFASKGLVFKTYEGELNIGGVGNIPNTAQMNQIWDFSVKNQRTADTLTHLEGRKVSLHYRKVLKSMFWQGETKYFVDGVQVINQ